MGQFLEGLSDPDRHDAALLRFQWRLLEDTGYRPQLSQDVRTGKPLDLPKYRKRVTDVLKEQPQVSLRELIERYPIESGIVDVVAYVAIAGEGSQNVFYPETMRIDLNRQVQPRFAELQKIIFLK